MIPTYPLQSEPQARDAFAEQDGILFFKDPWVPGFMSKAYYGPIHYELFFPAGTVTWLEGIQIALEEMAKQAHILGANAIVACEMSVDPYPTQRYRGLPPVLDKEPTLRLYMVGTGACLGRI